MAENNTITIDLSGDQELFFALVALPGNVQDRVAKTAFAKPAERIRDAAQALAPVSKEGSHGNPAGFLRKNIKVRSLKPNKFRVGVSVGTSDVEFTGKAFYAYFQEYGWRVGKRKWRNRTKISERASKTQELRDKLGRLRTSADLNLTDKGRKALLGNIKTTRRALGEVLKASQQDKRRMIPGKFFFRRAFDANKNIRAAEMKANIIEAIQIETDKVKKQFTNKILNPTVKGAGANNRAVRLLNATDRAVSVDDSIAGFLAG